MSITSSGVHSIVVTRPRQQVAGLVSKLKLELPERMPPLEVIELPLLELQTLVSPQLASELREALCQADLVIFVSPNAVSITDSLLKDAQLTWPDKIRIGLTGGGSQAAIEALEINAQVVRPQSTDQWDSEGLWDCLKQESWQQKNVVFVRGEGGRPWLAEQFKQAGAKTKSFEVYRREALSVNDPCWVRVSKMLSHLDANPKERQLWLLTSSEAVLTIPKAFEELSLNPKLLTRLDAMCSHTRIAQAAREVGFGRVIVCSAGDESLIRASIQWASNLP